LLLGSCSFPILKGYQHGNETMDIEPVSWFRTDSGYLLMNTRIDLMKNHFSGIMVIKSLPNLDYRVVFLTEIGLKIWDLEFSPGKPVKVVYIVEALNRGKVLKTLTQDLRLVLMPEPDRDVSVIMYHRSAGDWMLKYREKGRKYYYHYLPGTNKASNALVASRLIKKAVADFYSRDGIRIDSVKLAHYNIKLRFQMFRIDENSHHADQ
jgi:hypothetical protein